MSKQEQSYYDILGVDKSASQEEIKKKWKALQLKYHPDKLPEEKKAWGETMIKEVNEAYAVISNPEKRQMYDQFGKEGLQDHGMPGGFGGGFDPSELFGNIFNGKQQRQQQVPIIKVSVKLSMEDIFKGKSVEQHIERYSLCQPCNYTGFIDKTKHTCKTCNGVGMVMQTVQIGPGMYQQIHRPCTGCKGTKIDKTSEHLCKKCDGVGASLEKYTLKFNIEPGVTNEDVVQINNEGHELPEFHNKMGRGSVIVEIEEIEHERFKRGVIIKGKRNPADISMELPISFVESVCGFSKTFKHLDDRELNVKPPPFIVQNGDLYCIKEEGLPIKANKKKGNHVGSGGKGDLYIKFIVEKQQSLSDDKKMKIYELLTGQKFKFNVEEETLNLLRKKQNADERNNSEKTDKTNKSKGVKLIAVNPENYTDDSDDSDDDYQRGNMGGGQPQCAQQ